MRSGICFLMSIMIRLPECLVVERHIFALDSLKRKEGAAPHNDPFDLMLISQAEQEGILFLTHDSLLSDYQEVCFYKV